MADQKVTALTAIGTLGTDDLFYVVDDPGGTPLSRKATGSQVRTFALGAAGQTTPSCAGNEHRRQRGAGQPPNLDDNGGTSFS